MKDKEGGREQEKGAFRLSCRGGSCARRREGNHWGGKASDHCVGLGRSHRADRESPSRDGLLAEPRSWHAWLALGP